MSFSYLSNGQSITGVSVDSYQSNGDTPLNDNSTSIQMVSEKESFSYIDNLNLRRRGLNHPQDIIPYLFSFSSTISLLLVELDLSRNELSDLPSEIEELKQLKHLNLACNRFIEIPNVIFKLSTLTHLNLMENKLTTLNQLPKHLPKLQSLKLSGNRLYELDDHLELWKDMKVLQLGSESGGNRLKKLPDSLLEMDKLQELDLSNNRLNELSLSLPASLKYLKVSGNHLKKIPDDILIQCPHLINLDLSFNRLIFLPFFFYPSFNQSSSSSSSRRHTTLDISHNNITIVPTSVLNLFSQVILFGNPTLEYNRKSTSIYAQKLRELSKIAVYSTTENNLFMDLTLINILKRSISHMTATFSNIILNEDNNNNNNNNDHRENNYLIPSPSSSTTSTTSSTSISSSETIDRDFNENEEEDIIEYYKEKEYFITENGESWIPSLRELTMRHILNEEINKWKDQEFINNIPCTIVNDLKISNPCDICGMPCIREWLSALQVKSYKTYTSVVCKITLCSTSCWLIHYQNTRMPSFSFTNGNNLHHQIEIPFGLLNNDNDNNNDNINPLIQVQLPPLRNLEPDSFEWIVAAANASAIQLEQDQALI